MDDRLRKLDVVQMDAKHIEAVAQLEKLCFSAPWSENALIEELSNPLAMFLVAELDGKVVGYAGLHQILDEGFLTNVAVHPDFRQMGIATKLLEALDDYAEQNQLSFISLEVRKSNQAAIALYEKIGYKKEGERKEFYRLPAEDADIMTKRF